MGKKEKLIEEITHLLNDEKTLEKYLIENCNLPGTRTNLELIFAFAEVFRKKQILKKWLLITANIADANNPQSFLPMCALVCFGKLYVETSDEEILGYLKKFSNDSRWRIRECVAFAFQIIGEKNFRELEHIFTDWFPAANNLEKRAMLVALAHPPLLNKESAAHAIDITDRILSQFDEGPDIDILKKSLEFVISVYTVANPVLGFRLLEKWIGKGKSFNSIIKSNLNKNRLVKNFPEQVAKYKSMLN